MELARKSSGVSDFGSRICDLVFCFVCACHGLRTGFPGLRRAACIYWFISALSAPFTCAIYFYAMIIAPTKHVSLSQVISSVGLFNFMISAFASLFIFVVKHKNIEELLQSSGRNSADIVVPILAWIPFVVYYVIAMMTTRKIEIILGIVNYFNFTNSMTIFVMVYLDIINDLLLRLRKLHELCRATRIHFKALASEKSRIRGRIETINTYFAFPLAVQYLQIFIAFLYVFATLIRDSESKRLNGLGVQSLAGTLVGFLGAIFFIAWRASRLIAQCHATESQLMILAENDAGLRDSSQRMDLRDIFRYRQEWDSLMVGCFECSVSSLLRYMATVTTCVAVVLQFDFEVVRTINSLAIPT